MDGSIITEEAIFQLRGENGFTDVLAVVLVAIFMNWYNSFFEVEGFLPHPVDPGWGLDRPNTFQPRSGSHKFPPYYEFFSPRRTPSCPLEINRLTAMPHQEFVALSKEERRQFSDSKE
jgi:hypothetical protein